MALPVKKVPDPWSERTPHASLYNVRQHVLMYYISHTCPSDNFTEKNSSAFKGLGKSVSACDPISTWTC